MSGAATAYIFYTSILQCVRISVLVRAGSDSERVAVKQEHNSVLVKSRTQRVINNQFNQVK